MKPLGFHRFAFSMMALVGAATPSLLGQWTGEGAGGAAKDASNPANYTGGSIGNFSGNTADAILDLQSSVTTVGGLNLNYAANPISLTLGDGIGSQTLTLDGNVTFTRAATVAGTSSFIMASDVNLDLGNASRSIIGTTVTGDLGTFNLTFNGAVTSNGAGNQRLTISAGSPTVTFNGNVTLDGGITFSAGTSTVAASSVLNVTGAGANALQSNGGVIATINGQVLGGASDTVGVSGGILWLANATNTYSGTHTVSGGILRGTDGAGINSGNILLSGGVFESTTTTTFTRSLGTGANQVRLTAGNAGFSSRGAAAVFNLGGAGATVEWGSSFFNPGSFVLGTANSDNTTEFQNGIDLKGGSRNIFINGGTGSTISGIISDSTGGGGYTVNSSTANSNIVLTLTQDNTYTGRTVIANTAGATGTLVISRDRNLGMTPVTAVVDNLILAPNGRLRVTESFTLDANRGIGIGSGAGGSSTGGINVDANRTLTYAGIVANRTRNVDGSASSANTGAFQKTGTGTLYLAGRANTYTGGTFLSAGTLRVTKISNGGVASSIGASTNASGNLVLGNGRLEYFGSGDSTDRLFAHSTSTVIDSSGTGALSFTNTGAIGISGTVSGARSITLTGYNKDENVIASAIGDSGAGSNTVGVFKNGSGNWTLSGTNTYTGSTRVNNGILTLDYSAKGNTADPLSATSAVSILGGTLAFRGKTTGITTETVASLSLLSVNPGGYNQLVLDGNGGGGVKLTIESLVSNGNPQAATLIDLSSSAGNSITVNALGASIASNTTGNVLMTNTNRANIIVKDATGYGFATLSTAAGQNTATPGATIGRLTTGVDLDAMGNAATLSTENYFVDASFSRTATLNFHTITIDASGPSDLTIGLGAALINNGEIGRGILITGDKDVAFTGTGSLGISGGGTYFNHYGTGVLSLSQNMLDSGTTLFSGTGRINYTGTVGGGHALDIQGTTFRLSKAMDLAAASQTGILSVNSGGVFEIGADLNDTAAGDLTNAVGASGSARQIRFYGDSGVSAAGADRVVNFGGAGATLNWGAGHFLTNMDGTTDGDNTFKLSSSGADAKVTIENGINLNNRNRTIDVANGGATVDAALTGEISGVTVGVTKVGAGTLEISGSNSYSGATRVLEGKLMVTGGGINASTQIFVRNATLELGGSQVLNDTAGITLENARIIANGHAETSGTLTLIGNNQLDLVNVGNVIHLANSSGMEWGSTLVITDWTGNSTGGGSDQIYFGTNSNGLTSDQLSKISFLNPNVDGIGQTGIYSATILANGEVVAGILIPEPSAVLLGSMGVLGCAFRRRRN
jgi:fibronectin-binding autotransporter adhesin